MPNIIESVRIEGFRFLADVEIGNLPRAMVPIGPNGSGKSDLIRFFDLMSWMVGSRRLSEFVGRQRGADDRLFGGGEETGTMDAQMTLRTDTGRIDYRFALARVCPDRLVFADEAVRFGGEGWDGDAARRCLGSGRSEARIVEIARSGARSALVEVVRKRGSGLGLANVLAVSYFHGSAEKRMADAIPVAVPR